MLIPHFILIECIPSHKLSINYQNLPYIPFERRHSSLNLQFDSEEIIKTLYSHLNYNTWIDVSVLKYYAASKIIDNMICSFVCFSADRPCLLQINHKFFSVGNTISIKVSWNCFIHSISVLAGKAKVVVHCSGCVGVSKYICISSTAHILHFLSSFISYLEQ